MKKIISVLLLSLTMGLVGCSAKSEVKDIPVEEIKTAINNETLLSVQPTAEMDAKESYVFESVKDKIIEGFVIQAMINVKLQDVFVIKTDDTEAVMKAIEDYKTSALQLFADGYGGEENASSVANAKLEVVGNYVYFIAAPNVEAIEVKILEMIK